MLSMVCHAAESAFYIDCACRPTYFLDHGDAVRIVPLHFI